MGLVFSGPERGVTLISADLQEGSWGRVNLANWGYTCLRFCYMLEERFVISCIFAVRVY
jgi:hypothetical protein